jgi:hypothetical protein
MIPYSRHQENDTEFTESLFEVMRKKNKPLHHPVLIFINGEYKFNGINYKCDEEAANKARRSYYEQLKK